MSNIRERNAWLTDYVTQAAQSIGPTGDKGDTGDGGPTGPSGGPIGPTGPIGLQGPAGGPTGGRGSTGAKGDRGDTGVKGDTGDSGVQGDTGPQGGVGKEGERGVSGPKGDDGIQGHTGHTGMRGDTGIQGDTGDQGIQGHTGHTGMRGDAGIQGDTGDQGIQGHTGHTGMRGDAGIQGVTGPGGAANHEVLFFNVFDNSYATTTTLANTTTPTPWVCDKEVILTKGDILFHDIRVSGYISTDYDFEWPPGGHKWLLRRSEKTDANLATGSDWYWDSSNSITSKEFKHTFNTQGDHEETIYSMTESIGYDVSYNRWRCDFSGMGGLNNIDDKLTWTITKITNSNYWTPTAELDTNVDIIGKLNVGNLNSTANTQTSTLDVSGDVAITGKLIVYGAIETENIKHNQEILLIKLFDNSYATLSDSVDIQSPSSWIQHKNLLFESGTILFHNIKVSGFISKKYDFEWPENGHKYVIRRSMGENISDSDDEWYWDNSLNFDFKDFKHTFNTQGEHEESTFSMTETIPYEISYNSWRCDISGDGGLNNVDDRLTWTITKIASIPYFTPIEKNSLITYDISSNGVSSFNDISVNSINALNIDGIITLNNILVGDISSNKLTDISNILTSLLIKVIDLSNALN